MKEKIISQAIKTGLIEDFNIGERSGIYAATQKMMAYNSNKIEGSTLTSEQTASLFDTGTITTNGIEVYKAKDIEEMNGHFKMFNHMIKTIEQPLSIEMIKTFHYQLKNGVFEDLANGYPVGEFKNRANIVSDIKTVRPSEVESRIRALLEKYESSNKDIFAIADFHADYEYIHPFQDGNGRTGRIILFKQCLENELLPIVIKDEDKLIYYKALHCAQVERNNRPLIDFFTKCQDMYLDYIKDFICDYTKKNNPTLFDKKNNLNEGR